MTIMTSLPCDDLGNDVISHGRRELVSFPDHSRQLGTRLGMSAPLKENVYPQGTYAHDNGMRKCNVYITKEQKGQQV